MFLTINGHNSVAITLINAKLCMNIVVGSALSLVTQRKNYSAPIGGTTAHFCDSLLGEGMCSLSAFLTSFVLSLLDFFVNDFLCHFK